MLRRRASGRQSVDMAIYFHGCSASIRAAVETEGLHTESHVYLTPSIDRATHYATGAACLDAVERGMAPVGLIVVVGLDAKSTRPDRLDAMFDPHSQSVVVDRVPLESIIELREVDLGHLPTRGVESAARWRVRRLDQREAMRAKHGSQEGFADALEAKMLRLREAWTVR